MAAVIAVIAVAAGACSDALGAQTRPLERSFGSFSNPQGLAIEQTTGDIYVADTGNDRIEKFDPLGNLVVGFGANVGGSGVNTCTTFCEAGTQGAEPGQFTTAEFVAVDNDPTSASFHDVYVADTGDNAISKFDASGNLVTTWGSGGQLNGSTTGEGTFGALAGIAVDSEGNLLVITGGSSSKLFKFTQGGTFTTEASVLRVTAAHGLAVAPNGNMFKVNGDGSVQELSSTGSSIGTVTRDDKEAEPVVVIDALAVDPVSGDLYVSNAANSIDHFEFNGSGKVVESDGAECEVVIFVGCTPTDSTPTTFVGEGIAEASSSGDVYLSNQAAGEVFEYGPLVTVPDVVTAAASEVGPSTARLNGTVNPDEVAVTSCEFEYISDATLMEMFGSNFQQLVEGGVPVNALFEFAGVHAACEQPSGPEVGSGSSPVPVHADLTGLSEGTRYHDRLVAGNANGSSTGAIQTFVTVAPPIIVSASVANVTSASADLVAKINPNNGETAYHFEYDTRPYLEGEGPHGTSVPVPPGQIPGGAAPIQVTQHITGLEANLITYHWRVTATNAAGTVVGVDHSFFYEEAAPSLPDGRAYEMVTPPHKNGALIGDTGGIGLGYSLASDGSHMIGATIQCFAGAQSCNAHHQDAVGSPYLFERTSSGWVPTPISPPATQFASNTPWAFAADSDVALFSMATPPFGEDDFYKREADGRFVDMGPITPPQDGPLGPQGGSSGAAVQMGTLDLSHFIWDTGKDPSHWPFDETEESTSTSAYEYVGVGNSQPFLVGVTGGRGSTDLVSRCGTSIGLSTNESAPGTMSADGRTVYFTANRLPGGPCPGGSGTNAGTSVPANALYARIDGELSDAHTVAISQRSSADCTTTACTSSPPGDAGFRGASEDGSIAYFTDTHQLTNDASEDEQSEDSGSARGCTETIGANGCNLYVYDFNSASGHELAAASAGDTSGNGPQVQGVMAISADGSHAYFVAKGVLAQNESAGAHAQAGKDNLYVYERDAGDSEGHVGFIATLAESDAEQWQETGERSNVDPSGRFFVFVSRGDLTPDDTSRSGAAQVFRYDAESGVLTRISVGNDGFNDNGNRSVATPCSSVGCSEDANIAAPAFHGSASGRRATTMSNDGSFVFFTSPVALTAHALDDVRIDTDNHGNPVYAENVYEWHEGHVHLISDGRDVSVNSGSAGSCAGVKVGPPSSVCLLGSDTTGDNVFFATSDQLVAQDTDTELDYYDARVCTAGDPCLNQTPARVVVCDEESCQGAPATPPTLPSTASSSLSGTGNITPAPPPTKPKPRPLTRAQKLAKALKACHKKHNKHKRQACEKRARKLFGPKKSAKKAAKRGAR